MSESPYSRFESEALILRDELAVDRTALANERTLLAYLRSAVSMVIAGVTIMHFSEPGWFSAVGLACVPIGIVVGIIGTFRYRKMAASIRRLRQQSGSLASSIGCSGIVGGVDLVGGDDGQS